MTNRLMRRALLMSCSVLVWSTAARAQSVSKGVVVSVDAEANSNPYPGLTGSSTNSGGNDWVAAGNVEVRPWLSADNETSRFRLEAYAQLRAYTSRYQDDDSYGASMSVTKQPNARTSLYASASISSRSARSRYNYLTSPVPTIDPTQPDIPPVTVPTDDVTLLGATGRSTAIGLAAGSSMQISARSSIGANVGYQKLILSSVEGQPQGTDYDSANVGLSWSRALSERTSVGTSATASFTNYQGPFPDANTVSLLGNLDSQINEEWSLSASAGVSSTHTEGFGPYPSSTQTFLAGGVSLCSKHDQRNACLSYRRSQQPSSLGSVRKSDQVSATYSDRLSDRGRISLGSSYSRSAGDDRFNTGIGDVELLSLSATFTRTIDKRIDGYVFGNASRSWGGYLSREPSYAVGVGLTIRLGDLR